MTDRKILVADDDADMRHMVSLSLQLEGYDVESFENGEQVLNRMANGAMSPSLLILDLLMPGLGGMETLRKLQSNQQRCPVLVLSCLNSPDMVVEAMQVGAADYMVKPFENEKLQARVSRLLGGKGSQIVPRAAGGPAFVASNPKMLKIQDTIRRIAHADVPVLIHGQSGVGKEVVARTIHETSNRRGKPFLKINCAAVPSELLESEMFGYERGAFTGAVTSKPGKFEMADTGTVFLDEISEMSPSLQAKLLQVLQDSQFSRLGGKSLIHVDARVLAATNADLDTEMRKGTFREDLYYRLNVVNIHVPPLRDRMDELEAIAAHFWQKYAPHYGRPGMQLPARLLEAMRQYDWPGNIRELENVVRRAIVLDGTDLVAEELEQNASNRFRRTMKVSMGEAAGGAANGSVNETEETEEVPFAERVNGLKRKAEKDAILAALNRTNWNRKEAAKLLNISYKSLLYRIKVLGLAS
jgi:two-component system, NtrC family, response regulator AtoC